MNQHLGATYSLSVLIVVAFAIAFYRADPPPPQRRQAANTATRAVKAEKNVAQTTSGAHAVSSKGLPTPKVASRANAPLEPRVTLGRPIEAEPRPETLVRPVSRVRPVARTSSRSAFTTVNEQETLDDVAQRIYGTTDESERLWKANRDLLPDATSPLRVGMLLRTP